MGAARDAARLSAFGRADAFGGIVDLGPGSLADLVAARLGRFLAKRKYRGSRRGKDAKRAHWRAAELTPLMRGYAARDAAASRAVALADPAELLARRDGRAVVDEFDALAADYYE